MSRENLAEGTNFSLRLPAAPYDDNSKPFPVLFGAVVEDGVITKFLPIKCKDNGDGTCSLIVDTSG